MFFNPDAAFLPIPDSGSLLLAIWIPTYSARPGPRPICYAQIVGEPESPLCFFSHPLLRQSRKRCLRYLSRRCQGERDEQ